MSRLSGHHRIMEARKGPRDDGFRSGICSRRTHRNRQSSGSSKTTQPAMIWVGGLDIVWEEKKKGRKKKNREKYKKRCRKRKNSAGVGGGGAGRWLGQAPDLQFFSSSSFSIPSHSLVSSTTITFIVALPLPPPFPFPSLASRFTRSIQ